MILFAVPEKIVGIVAGVLTAASLLPQLVKMIKERDGSEISIGMLTILSLGLATWVWYGILREDWPIIITNSFSLIVNLLMIVLRFVYKRPMHV